MSRLARRLIEAIQHSLLGSLFWRLLWPNLFWFMFLVQWSTRDGPREQQGEDAVAAIIAISFLTASVAWMLGAVARPAYRSPDLSTPSNGFEVWTRTPPGGLRPPSPFRALLRLSQAWPKRLNPVAVAVAVLCLFLVWLLATLPNQAVRLHPALSDPELRSTVIVVSFTLSVLIDLTGWARQQAARLAPA